MNFLNPYKASNPTRFKYLKKKSPQNPIKVIFAELKYKLMAWIIDALILGSFFWFIELHWTLWLISAVLYFTLLELSFLRGSIGEYLAGIRVIHRSGKALSWKHALSRNTTYLLTGGLSSLSSFFSRKNCALHDQIAHTLSIREVSFKSKD